MYLFYGMFLCRMDYYSVELCPKCRRKYTCIVSISLQTRSDRMCKIFNLVNRTCDGGSNGGGGAYLSGGRHHLKMQQPSIQDEILSKKQCKTAIRCQSREQLKKISAWTFPKPLQFFFTYVETYILPYQSRSLTFTFFWLSHIYPKIYHICMTVIFSSN